MRFPTVTGEDVGVIGDLPELGNWDPKKCLKLKWYQDHVWETVVPLVTNRPYFKYKYVQYSPTTKIEDGMDRVAELRLLPEIKNRGVAQRQQASQITQSQAVKQVELNDEWEAFRAHFTIWHPQDVTMRISGSRPELGDWGKGSGHLVMRRAPNSRSWMNNQYGTPMRPYECIVTLKQGRQTTINEPIYFTYNYSIVSAGGEQHERTQVRKAKIVDPSNYTGHLAGDPCQVEVSENFIINGELQKCDGTFVPAFSCSHVADTNVFVGPYVQNISDLGALRSHRIQAVLNLLTQHQMAERGIDWARLQGELRAEGVTHIVHCPVDANSSVNHEQVFEAAQRLQELVAGRNSRVFVQCQAGLTVAPSVVLAYLTLYKRVDTWESVSETTQVMRQSVRFAQPNETLVEKIVDDNLEFQARQYDRETVEALRIREQWAREDEANRLADEQELENQRRISYDNAQARSQREAAHRRETDAYKAQRDVEHADQESKQRQEQQRLDQLAQSYREERARESAEFQKLQAEKARELENLRRERDSVQREAEDLGNQIQALQKSYEEEKRKYAQIEGDLQGQVDHLNQQYATRRQEIEAELAALRASYEEQIAVEQARLDALSPEVEAILAKKASQSPNADRARVEQFQREREERRRLSKKVNGDRLAKEQKRGARASKGDEHYCDAGITSNYSEAQLEQQCNKLFASAPIVFSPTQGNPLEEDLYKIYFLQHVTVPIVHIRDKLYLIGSNRMTCDIRSGSAVVKVGGGYERFDIYISKNERQLQRRLVTYMINNQASLEWVVTQLIEGKNVQAGAANGLGGFRTSTSKAGSPKRKSTFGATSNPMSSPLNSQRKTLKF